VKNRRYKAIFTIGVILILLLLMHNFRARELFRYCDEGKASLNAGRYREAVGYFEKALAVYPDCKEATSYLGVSYEALGDNSRALSYYKKSLHLKPGCCCVCGYIIECYGNLIKKKVR